MSRKIAPFNVYHFVLGHLGLLKDVYTTVDLLEFYKTQGTIGFPVRIALLINIPKGFSSKMTLEVAKIGLKVSTQYML